MHARQAAARLDSINMAQVVCHRMQSALQTRIQVALILLLVQVYSSACAGLQVRHSQKDNKDQDTSSLWLLSAA